MSRIKEEYQKQTDAFCEKNNTISAQDIWNKAQNRAPSEEKVVEFKPRKSKGMVWKAAIPAIICFLLVSTTTVTATGYLSDLSDWFRNLFKDEKTAEIIADFARNLIRDYRCRLLSGYEYGGFR